MEVANTGSSTVKTHTALLFEPSVVVAVIIAVPVPMALILPVFLSEYITVATSLLLVVQVTALWLASLGKVLAVNVPISPTAKVYSHLSRETPTAETFGSPV